MKKILRPATAMIELIFAIVIMGIVMMSAPQLISIAAKSGYVTIQQEAISEAASQASMVMGYAWDEQNTNERYIPTVLHTSTAGNSMLNENGTSGLRKGTPRVSRRSFIRRDAQEFNATAIGALGSDSSDLDDIDDFAGDTNMTLIHVSEADYIENDTINIHTVVSYITDSDTSGTYTPNGSNTIYFNPNFSSTPPGSTNIKRITVTLTSTSGNEELNKTIVFNAFSCNIGAIEFEEKSF